MLRQLAEDRDGWKAVLEHYPHDQYHANEARRELGMLYLQQGAEDKALQQFDALAGLRDDTDAEFRAFGLAGQAVVLSLKEEHAKSNAQACGIVAHDGQTRSIRACCKSVRDVVRENDLVLKRQTDEQWEKLFQERCLKEAASQPDSG